MIVINALVLIIMTVLGAFGGFFLKLSGQDKRKNRKGQFLNHFFILGGGFYFSASLLNIWLLNRLPLSVVLPMTSMTYVWTFFIAKIFLKERITVYKVLGLIFLSVGVVVIALQ